MKPRYIFYFLMALAGGILGCGISAPGHPLIVSAVLTDTSHTAPVRYLSAAKSETLLIHRDGTYAIHSRDSVAKEGLWRRPANDSLALCIDGKAPCARLTRIWIHDVAGVLRGDVKDWKETPISANWP